MTLGDPTSHNLLNTRDTFSISNQSHLDCTFFFWTTIRDLQASGQHWLALVCSKTFDEWLQAQHWHETIIYINLNRTSSTLVNTRDPTYPICILHESLSVAEPYRNWQMAAGLWCVLSFCRATPGLVATILDLKHGLSLTPSGLAQAVTDHGSLVTFTR